MLLLFRTWQACRKQNGSPCLIVFLVRPLQSRYWSWLPLSLQGDRVCAYANA
jgi:hypothetical protein